MTEEENGKKLTKLAKKATKAARFKQGKEARLKAVAEKTASLSKIAAEAEDQPARKRKAETELKSRYILFVGNLPYDAKEEEIKAHFVSASPNLVRPRKGFAFIEFSGDDAVRRLNIALKAHHSELRHRRINVELTAGGGGNCAKRQKKLQEKNDKLKLEHLQRKAADNQEESRKDTAAPDAIHPSRAKLVKH